MKDDLFNDCPVENMVVLARSNFQNSHASIIWLKLGFDQTNSELPRFLKNITP